MVWRCPLVLTVASIAAHLAEYADYSLSAIASDDFARSVKYVFRILNPPHHCAAVRTFLGLNLSLQYRPECPAVAAQFAVQADVADRLAAESAAVDAADGCVPFAAAKWFFAALAVEYF